MSHKRRKEKISEPKSRGVVTEGESENPSVLSVGPRKIKKKMEVESRSVMMEERENVNPLALSVSPRKRKKKPETIFRDITDGESQHTSVLSVSSHRRKKNDNKANFYGVMTEEEKDENSSAFFVSPYKRMKKTEAKSYAVITEEEKALQSKDPTTTIGYRSENINNNLHIIKMRPDERVTDLEVVSMVVSDDDRSNSSGESYYSIESKFEILSKTCSVYRWNIEQFQCKLFSGLDLYSMPFKLSPTSGEDGDSNSNTFELKMTWFDKRKNKIKVELVENGITNDTQNRYRIFITCEGNGFFNSQSLTVNAWHCEPFLYVNYVTVDVTEACNSRTVSNFVENDTLFMNCYFELK